jgi:hypothetical protein
VEAQESKQVGGKFSGLFSDGYLFLDGTFDIAYSASAVIVRLGFTPGLAGIIEPSMMYIPG